MDGITIYNFPAQLPKWDRVGIFFVTFAAVWTTIVASGMVFCLWNRHIPALKMRSLPLAFAGITLLHLYWCMAQIVYPIGGTMPMVIAYTVQYFIMGTWYPLGIALFHAANLKFLRFVEMQKQFESSSPQTRMRAGEGRTQSHTSWTGRWRSIRADNKVFILIGVAMVCQVALTTGMWIACEKYHPGLGVSGTQITGATLPEQLIDLGRGWEWWPSVLWQFVWMWMVAPFLIWRAWGIHDTMGWRTQTIGACLSGLHATPMFLISSYCSVFYTSGINSYFPPSQWIHLSTMFIEVFTVFIPAYQVVKHWRFQHAAAARKMSSTFSLATTFNVRPTSKSHSEGKGSMIELIDRNYSVEYLQSGDRLMTMAALTRVLTENPTPLQDFSARCDFSGENIAFLTRLSKWKQFYPVAERKQAFDAALRLYIDFVSPLDADFPLNLSSPQLKALQSVFECAARAVCGKATVEPVLPFAEPPKTAISTGPSETSWLQYQGEIPDAFYEGVFDDAKEHIESLVLTNTWPKFVKEMQEKRRSSVDSERSAGSAGSDGSDGSSRTVVSRISKFVAGLRQ